MARWVTCYWSIIGGVRDVVEHKTRDEATRYFRRNYRSYFELSGPFNVKLPCTYGYPHRKFMGISKRVFEKMFGKQEGSAK